MSEDNANVSVSITAQIWYDEEQKHIKLANGSDFITTFSNDPNSERYHPNAFKKLAALLRRHGKPTPNIDAT